MGRRGKKKQKKEGGNANDVRGGGVSTSGGRRGMATPKIVEEINESDDDEEIPEDEAFNSEDERLYGHFFQDSGEGGKKNKTGLESSEDEEVTSGEEESGSEDDDDDDDDSEDEDDDGGQYMLELLNKLDESKSNSKDDGKLSLSKMGKIPESDFSNSISKTGLTLDNLMEGIQDTQGFRDLQKTFSKQQAATPAPLDKSIANRVERKMAYEAKSKDLSRWVKAIQENRQAETLDFKPKERVELTRDTLVEKFEATTDFEKEIEKALEEAGQQDEEAVLKAEEDALQDDLGANRLTMEEYKKRRGQLAQIRALMFYHEQKQHHIKKIKSKKYRKIRKKQREKLKAAALEAAVEDDEELVKELKEKEEVARIQERMTLAHKNTSKWAKRILKRGKNVDVDTRRALSAQLKRGDDLRKKMMGEQEVDSDNDDSDDEDLLHSARKVLQDTEDASDPTHGKTGLFKLSFMQKGIQKQKELAREEARKLLSELKANQMDDYDDVTPSDEEKEDTPKTKGAVATAKDMKNVLEKGELVATSLEFGNSNSIATTGGIEIDLGISIRDETNQVEANANEDNVTESREEKVTVSSDERLGSRDFVSTLKIGKEPAVSTKSNTRAVSLTNQTPSNSEKRKAKESALAPSERGQEQNEQDESNPWMKLSNTESSSDKRRDDQTSITKAAKKAKRKGVIDVAGAVDILDAGKKDDIATTTDQHVNSESTPVDHKEGKKISSLTQEELVRKAFVGQSEKEIEEEFQKEKEAMAVENDPTRKVIHEKKPDEVAGWGSWTGQGTLPPKPRKLPKKLQAPKKKEEKRKRLDDFKPGVIINQKRLKKTANNYMLGDVPYPYATRAEYEQAMLGGVGKEWNVTSSFKSMTRPEILTRAGKIIQPISKKAKQPRPAAKF